MAWSDRAGFGAPKAGGGLRLDAQIDVADAVRRARRAGPNLDPRDTGATGGTGLSRGLGHFRGQFDVDLVQANIAGSQPP